MLGTEWIFVKEVKTVLNDKENVLFATNNLQVKCIHDDKSLWETQHSLAIFCDFVFFCYNKYICHPCQ